MKSPRQNALEVIAVYERHIAEFKALEPFDVFQDSAEIIAKYEAIVLKQHEFLKTQK